MRNATHFAAGRALDVICLGRFAVDFYAQQIGARLEDVTSFAKYLGGSSANTAFGCARLGLKAGLISRIGDDALGHFLVETISREGCDVSHVGTDPTRLTGAVVLGIKDRDTFPLIFLR
jgi:5-dehydro-2-deoxygluconokinase